MNTTPAVMTDERWPWVRERLVCPGCGGALGVHREDGTDLGLTCGACGMGFRVRPGSAVLDLRCPDPKRHTVAFTIGALNAAKVLTGIPRTPPTVHDDRALPPRTSPHVLTVLGERVPANGVVVEVGGGAGRYRDLVTEMGLRFVTTDYDSATVDLLVDAHALPFRSGSVDALLMQSVSQALENPFVAFAEAQRVLTEGGLLLGTADCCAVFAASYFNMTPWGVLAVMAHAGFTVERMWVTKDALKFCGTNPGYPAAFKPLLRILSWAARWRFWTPRLLLAGQPRDEFVTAGSLAFVARKTSSATAAC